jgi:hypothetical protein
MIRLAFALALLTGCGDEPSEPMGNPVAENCGVVGSSGNELGIGKYCTKSSQCPAVSSGTALQCSNILVDESLPLMCSRLCDLAAPDPGCGSGAVCKNVMELGFDLDVCVPLACQPLFPEPLE